MDYPSDACPNKDNFKFWAKNDKCRLLPLTEPIHLNENIPYYMRGRVGDQSDTRPYKDNFKYLYVATFNKTDSC